MDHRSILLSPFIKRKRDPEKQQLQQTTSKDSVSLEIYYKDDFWSQNTFLDTIRRRDVSTMQARRHSRHSRLSSQVCRKCVPFALPATEAKQRENLPANPPTSQIQQALIKDLEALGGSQDVGEEFTEKLEACNTQDQLENCLHSLRQELWAAFEGVVDQWEGYVQSIRTKIQGKLRCELYLRFVTKGLRGRMRNRGSLRGDRIVVPGEHEDDQDDSF